MKNNQLKQMYRVIFIVLAFLVSLPAAYSFSRYPLPHENYINDFASVIQPNDAQELREKLNSLEKQTGIVLQAMAERQANSKYFFTFQVS